MGQSVKKYISYIIYNSATMILCTLRKTGFADSTVLMVPIFLQLCYSDDTYLQKMFSEQSNAFPERNLQTMAQNPVITITMENGGVIKAELYPEYAPNTVNNFLALAGSGFYNGLIFHRVIPGFMIQGGDPEGTGMGGPSYSIRGEFRRNGFKANTLKHTAGVLSMARAMNPNSAGSQFFIMHNDAPHLDGDYAAFGKVTEGMDVVDQIATVETDYSDRPMDDQRIATVTVETFGVDYPAPEKI